MKSLISNRSFSFLVISLIYIAAIIIGIITFLSFSAYVLLIRILISDVVSTLFVWMFGILLKNSSVYDPYWSVAPAVYIPLIVLYLNAFNTGTYLLIAVILFWGIRLTFNWAYTFQNLNIQDWRYTKLRNDNPKLWFITNLFGINLIPTTVVYLVMLSAIRFIERFTIMNLMIFFSSLICVFAVILQIIADTQLHKFRKLPANHGKVINISVWKYIRHPNYSGEILMWWGIYFMLISVDISLWIYFIGPLSNTLMFLFISIPLMENRQLQNKPEYAEYKARTGALLPKLF